MTDHPSDTLSIPPTVMAATSWVAGQRTYRRIGPDDLDHLRTWRNAQQSVLRQQHPIDAEHQRHWYEAVVRPSYAEERPANFLVACAGPSAPTSYGGLTNIDWVSQRGELSFLAATDIAGDEQHYAHEFGDFLRWIIDFSFDVVGFRRLFTETWSFREGHMSILELAGLRREGRLRGHVVKDGIVYDALIHGILAEDRRRE